MLEKFKNSSTKSIAEQSMSSQTPFESVMEFARRSIEKIWRNHNWLLHHDNAPSHTSLKTTEFVTNNNMAIAPHPPYRPDLAHCDFALFPKLKMTLKGRRFKTVSDIQKESQAILDSIKENDFRGAFEAWKKG
jgi:transposase